MRSRSPSGRARTRSARPSARIDSWTAAMPRARNRSSQPRTCSAIASVSSSPPRSSDGGVSPTNDVRATARTREVSCFSSASSRVSHSSQAGLSSTLPPLVTTLGTPRRRSSDRNISTCLRLNIRIATSPARTGRTSWPSSKVAPDESRRATSSARSAAMRVRSSSTGIVDLGPVRLTCRSRTGCGSGSPEKRLPSWCAVTSCTVMPGPSSAPPVSTWSASTTGPSERKLVARVCFVPAVSAASR